MINRVVFKLNGAGANFQFDTEREKGLSENYRKSTRNFNYFSWEDYYKQMRQFNRRHDTQHNDIQLRNTQHKGLICDTQHQLHSAFTDRFLEEKQKHQI